MPQVTIALITYNRPNFLRDAINGALSQTFKDFELLVLDNGSDNSTRQIIDSFDDSRIIYYRNEVNSREYMNEAFSLAKGKYLLITHDDDIMMPDMLKRQVKILENDSEVVAVACNMSDMDHNGKILKEVTHDLEKDLIFEKEQFIHFYLTKGISLTCPTVLMRLCIFRKYNLKFDLSVGPATDVYLWFMLNLIPYKIYFISKSLYYYRIHENQDSTLNKLSMEISLFKGLEALLINKGLNHYIDLLKKLKMDNIMSILTNYYINNKINKDEFNVYLDSLKNNGLDARVSKKARIRLILFKSSPFFYRILFSFYSKSKNLV